MLCLGTASMFSRVERTPANSQTQKRCLQIDFSEFKTYALRTQDSIAKCFAQLDADSSGAISVEDLVSHH